MSEVHRNLEVSSYLPLGLPPHMTFGKVVVAATSDGNMTSNPARSSDADNVLQDLSCVELQPGDKPYNALIKACGDSPVGAPSHD